MHVKFRRNLDRLFWVSLVIAVMSAAFTAYIFCNDIEIIRDQKLPVPSAAASG
jgi:hypothetical protein